MLLLSQQAVEAGAQFINAPEARAANSPSAKPRALTACSTSQA